ncbi:hypothetical protein B6S12_06180 [Helicobacter valdiviensis]|uniref:Uncharacterized protein n=1 Tax=Helicobacter valdiviensis TaxID=1458358 RepID=A0A2W6MU93_9HELI|nr:hypothetical protein [Helicobacter valdiviensis]PZT47972.1 hypothetical protein B6S12_06180 [Helicobacter valdiviensis]
MFEATINACKNESINLSKSLIQLLKDEGISANYAEFSLEDSGIYFILPNGDKIKVLFYQAKIQESAFKSKGDPFVHLFSCEEVRENLANEEFRAIYKTELKFFLGVYSHRVQTKFFYNKPLELCPSCKQKLLGKSLKEFMEG